MYSIQFIWI